MQAQDAASSCAFWTSRSFQPLGFFARFQLLLSQLGLRPVALEEIEQSA